MKKVISAAVLSLCVFGASSSAFAYFNSGELVQTVYQEAGPTNYGSVEYGTDLGINIASYDFSAAGTNVNLAATGNINVQDWSNLRLAVYGSNYSGASSSFIFATTSAQAPGFSSANISNFKNAASSALSQYATSGNQTTVTVPGLLTYDGGMNQASKNPGAYSGLNSMPSVGEADLGVLNTADHVDMYLYKVAYNAGWTMVDGSVNGAATPYVAVLRLNSDGSTVLNPNAAPVPVPASVLLLGSGLLGMLGIRRKES